MSYSFVTLQLFLCSICHALLSSTAVYAYTHFILTKLNTNSHNYYSHRRSEIVTVQTENPMMTVFCRTV